MDLSHVPDLVHQFAFAVQIVPELAHQAVAQAHHFVAAFSDEAGMSIGEKIYHAGKVVLMGGVFAASVIGGSVDGALASGFAEADEVYSLCQRGSTVPALEATPEAATVAPAPVVVDPANRTAGVHAAAFLSLPS